VQAHGQWIERRLASPIAGNAYGRFGMEGTLAEDLATVLPSAISIGFHLIFLADLLVYALSGLSAALIT